LEKDRSLHHQHASDIRSDLQRLKRDTDSGRSSAASAATVVVPEAPAPRVAKLWKIAGLVLLLTLLVSGDGRLARITVFSGQRVFAPTYH
jgi:hypothetical protein